MENESNLFQREEDIIQDANTIIAEEKFKENPLLIYYQTLLNSYKKLCKQSKKIVKISDHTQESLNITNKKLKKAFEEIESLNEISKYISKSLDFNIVFSKIVDYLKKTYGFEGFMVAMVNADKKSFVLEIPGLTPESKESVKEFTHKYYPLDLNSGVIAWCIINKNHIYISEMNQSEVISDLDRKIILQQNVKTSCIMPVIVDNEVIAAFCLTGHTKNIYLTPDDINSIERFVNQIAIIIKNSKLYQELQKKDYIISKDLLMAKKIQMNLFSKEYENIKDLGIEVLFQPMIEVGGDIYDIYKLKNQYYRIFIADATGHGVQGALTTMIIKTEYDKIKTLNISTDKVLTIFNNEFIFRYFQLCVFFTCMVIDIDLTKNKIDYSNAGNPNQYLIVNGQLNDIHVGGKMIGVRDNVEYEKRSVDFNPGNKLLLFTDGAFEQFSDKEELGEEGLESIIEKYKEQTIPLLVQNMMNEINQFRGNTPLNDDITIIGIEYKK